MSRTCDICGRGTMTGKSRSHSNIASNRKFAINLQLKKMDGRTVRICTKCLKTKSRPARNAAHNAAGGPYSKKKTSE